MPLYGGSARCQSDICIGLRKEFIPWATMTNAYKFRVYCKPCETFQRRDPRVDLEGKAQYCKCCGKRCRIGPSQGANGKIKYRKRRFKVWIEETILNISSDDMVVWVVNKPLFLLQERVILNG